VPIVIKVRDHKAEPVRLTDKQYERYCFSLAQEYVAEGLEPRPKKYDSRKEAQKECDKYNHTVDLSRYGHLGSGFILQEEKHGTE
jgi:hypothetical protein